MFLFSSKWRCWAIWSLHCHWCQHWAVWGGRGLWRLRLLEEGQGPSQRLGGDAGKFTNLPDLFYNPDRTQFERIISVLPSVSSRTFLTICERYKLRTVWPGNRATGIYLFCRAGCHDSCDLFIHSCFFFVKLILQIGNSNFWLVTWHLNDDKLLDYEQMIFILKLKDILKMILNNICGCVGALSVMTYRCWYQHIHTNKPKTSDREMMINGVSIYFPASTVRQKTLYFHLMD